ncbi:MAG: Xaa-Pro aminopeptidase [Paracoccaceae bacterium]|jgi:Xaa-Pro aminopeptidase
MPPADAPHTMLQSFDERADGAAGPARLAALRARMAALGVHGFLIPRADAHMGENVAARDERLAWLTGFTGSAGSCAATVREAALFVDGRYTLQAAGQTDTAAFQIQPLARTTPDAWLAQAAQPGETIAYDPWLHPRAEVERLRKAVESAGATLRATANLIDDIWADQPAAPAAPAVPHPDDLAGETSGAKRARVAADLAEAGAAAAVLTLPDSIAWLLNIRGGDIGRTPTAAAFAVLHANGKVDLFIDPAKVGPDTRAHLGNDVALAPPSAFEPALAALAGRAVAVDRDTAPSQVSDALTAAGADIIWRRDPCVAPKARKNAAELAGARAAHLRDGAAMVEFLSWLAARFEAGDPLTEIAVVEALEGFRVATGALRDISFETISGAGPNGAIIHYRVTRETNRAIAPGDLLLIDSGAQYRDGTTDLTRTVLAGGAAPDGAARAFTLVLRGMIDMARVRWPEGLEGRHLDALARAPLWAAGLDYDHGTGHGVGSYLGVHEGPAGLSRRAAEPLSPGMILSDEPGYYRVGAFGIRIENLLAVTPPSVPEGGEREMLGFETLTLAPIDAAMIDPDLLGGDARRWLDTYHARVEAQVGPLVSPSARAWLSRVCAPLATR